MSIVSNQVEFLVEGYLLPPTLEKLRISKNLILEQVCSQEKPGLDVTVAYVGVNSVGEKNYFPDAMAYMDFFLLIYTLMSGQRVTHRIGAGTTLDNMKSLGSRRVSFHVEKVHVMGKHKHKDDLLAKNILAVRRRFVQLLPDRQKIMNGHLGLALTFYYVAVHARRWEEAVISLIIAAEALLCTETKQIRRNLSGRLSALIEKDDTKKNEVVRKMLELYELRSCIIHGGGKKPSLNDTRVLFGYVRRAIERGLSLRRLLKKEFVARFDANS
jgi:hypothetical protein